MWLDIETTIELITTRVNCQWGKALSVFFKLRKNCTQCSVTEDWPFSSQMHDGIKTRTGSENPRESSNSRQFLSEGITWLSLELATGSSFLLLCTYMCLQACSSFLGSPLHPTPKHVCVCLRSVSFAVSPFHPRAADPAAALRSSPSVPCRPRRARILPTRCPLHSFLPLLPWEPPSPLTPLCRCVPRIPLSTRARSVGSFMESWITWAALGNNSWVGNGLKASIVMISLDITRNFELLFLYWNKCAIQFKTS